MDYCLSKLYQYRIVIFIVTIIVIVIIIVSGMKIHPVTTDSVIDFIASTVGIIMVMTQRI